MGYFENPSAPANLQLPKPVAIPKANVLVRIEIETQNKEQSTMLEMIRFATLGKCMACGWPLAESETAGCVQGNCSFRPGEHSPEYPRWWERTQIIEASRKRSLRTGDEFLYMVWREMRNDRSNVAVQRAMGAIAALQVVGILTVIEAEAWTTRFSRCPGHDDEGGRSWCAYCGNL